MGRRRGGSILLDMDPLHVIVAGGGFAAGEALLALRALAGDRVRLELIAADRTLAFRPAATALPFTGGRAPEFELAALAESVGATVRHDRVEAVAPLVRRLRLASGATATYDALLLAVGARARIAVPGAVTFRDHRDAGRVAAVLEDVRTRRAQRLAVAIPPGTTWSLPVYELALRAAELAEGHAEITVVTPERAPLEVFGERASRGVAELLADRDVRVLRESVARRVDATGLQLAYGGAVAADHVVALPELTGRRISGIPAVFGGFVPAGPTGRVEELHHVWAAGDMTAYPVKQGGIATQQAEAAASDIAAYAGADVPPLPPRPVLRARLDWGGEPLYLRTELDDRGRPLPTTTPTVDDESPWWPDAKVHGHHLSPYMALH